MARKKKNPSDPFEAGKAKGEMYTSIRVRPDRSTFLHTFSKWYKEEGKATGINKDDALTKFTEGFRAGYKLSNPGSLAEEISEGFHGRKVREELEIEEEELIPDNTAVLGCLLDITVTRDDGKTGIPIIFLRDGQKPKRGEEVYVCAPDRNNIEFIGGNQDIGNFSVLAKGDKNKQFVSLGKVESLAYLADKHHLQGSNGKEEPYEHSFGRKRFFVFGKRVGRPELLYDTRNCKISLVGGTYTIEDEGITN
jgi:hypothetical protein